MIAQLGNHGIKKTPLMMDADCHKFNGNKDNDANYQHDQTKDKVNVQKPKCMDRNQQGSSNQNV